MSSVDDQLAAIKAVNEDNYLSLLELRRAEDPVAFQASVTRAFKRAGKRQQANTIEGWLELTLNGTEAFGNKQRADIVVKSAPEVLAELYTVLDKDSTPFFEAVRASWLAAARKTSEFKVPVSAAHERVASRGDPTSIPYRMDEILTAHAYAADHSGAMREFYEETGLFPKEKETVDFCYAAHYVARITLSDILFVLELKRVQDKRSANESAFRALGVAQVIRRLATILQGVARKDEQPRVVLGAASNGYKIVFICMEENAEAFTNAWAAPYLISRSEVLLLSQPEPTSPTWVGWITQTNRLYRPTNARKPCRN